MIAPDSLAWSPWRPLAGAPPLSPSVLREILDGGQAFRWNPLPDGVWLGLWDRYLARLRSGPGDRLEWSAPATAAVSTEPALAAYFATDRDFAALTDTLPWRSDPHLARCLAMWPGLRLLRQPFGETLLGFICSATKRIPQIKQMLALLAARHGAPLPSLSTLNPQLSTSPHRLPTWPELARLSEADLRACLLGFRARHVAGVARFLAERPGWLEATEAAPYPDAKARLLELPGVGEKIADCVLLFGAGRLEAFPVDTWILQALVRRYGLECWRPEQVAQFGRAHFGPLAGLAQQFLFATERADARLTSPAESAPPRSPRARR